MAVSTGNTVNKGALRNAEGADKTTHRTRGASKANQAADSKPPPAPGYALLIALTGHSPSQAPQSMQVGPSIRYFGSPSLIADTGQTSLHAPHIVQASEIT